MYGLRMQRSYCHRDKCTHSNLYRRCRGCVCCAAQAVVILEIEEASFGKAFFAGSERGFLWFVGHVEHAGCCGLLDPVPNEKFQVEDAPQNLTGGGLECYFRCCEIMLGKWKYVSSITRCPSRDSPMGP